MYDTNLHCMEETYLKGEQGSKVYRIVCPVYSSIYTYNSTIHTLHFTWYSMHGRQSTPNLPYKALYVKSVSTRSKLSYSPAIKGSIKRFLSTCGSKGAFQKALFYMLHSIDVSTKCEGGKVQQCNQCL